VILYTLTKTAGSPSEVHVELVISQPKMSFPILSHQHDLIMQIIAIATLTLLNQVAHLRMVIFIDELPERLGRLLLGTIPTIS